MADLQLRRAAVERVVHGGYQFVDADVAVVVGVAGGTRRWIGGAERDVHHHDEIRNGHVAVPAAVANARLDRRRR